LPAPATPTLPLHDALPISSQMVAAARHTLVLAANASAGHAAPALPQRSAASQIPTDPRQIVVLDDSASAGHVVAEPVHDSAGSQDRKSTRLNSSHQIISYA